jgi:signal peptidase I
MRRLLRYLLSLCLTALLVTGVRTFCVGSFRISTGSMQPVLQAGDRVLVNKIHGAANPGRDRVVVFKSPLAKDRPAPPLILNRCVGMPGDTVQVTPDGYAVNGRLIRIAAEKTFRIRKNIKPALLQTMQRLDIPLRSVAEDSLDLVIRLTPREESLLRNHLHQKMLNIESPSEPPWSYTFVIPFKGFEYHPDSTSLFLYADAVRQETNGRIRADGSTLTDGSRTVGAYRFTRDYYWMLSDDSRAIDSRHLGLIPRSSITGNVWLCWFSNDKNHIFKQIH